MARNIDIRSYVAKTYPTLPIKTHSKLMSDLLKSVLETKKKNTFSSEHGQSFNFKGLDDIVHVKPGNRISLVAADISFTERSLTQFVMELGGLSSVRYPEELTFAKLYTIHDYFDAKEFMGSQDIAAFNGEVYSLVMKRWHNRHRDGSTNPITIRHRLKSIDAFVEIILSDFQFDEPGKLVNCKLGVNGDIHDYAFVIPASGKTLVGDNIQMGKVIEPKNSPLSPDRNVWMDTLNEISELTGSLPGNIHHSLSGIIGEMCCQIAANKESLKISSISQEYSLLGAYERENEDSQYMATITIRDIFGQPDKKYLWIVTYPLTRLLTDMNKTKLYPARQFPSPHHLAPITGLQAVTNRTFADFIPNFPKDVSSIIGPIYVESDKKDGRHIKLVPLTREIGAEPIFQVIGYDDPKGTITILYPHITRSDLDFVTTMHELINGSRNVDWEDVAVIEEPKPKSWGKRLLSLFK